MLPLIASILIVFGFTTVLTIAGVGAAFALVPFLYWLGFPLHQAMATCLLLNSISMGFALPTFVRNRMIIFSIAFPITVISVIFSPLGAWSTRLLSREILLWLFSGFLIFVASMMLFYRPKQKQINMDLRKELTVGGMIGALAGYIGGLLGVGGGNIIVPVLIWMGFDPRKASATSGFIVIFSSFAAFVSHAAMGHVNPELLAVSVPASILGGVVGAWLLVHKLKGPQVKKIIGLVLYLVAIKIIWDFM
jgi:uncharacterized membrane protein YfcA